MRSWALQAGFDDAGIATAEPPQTLATLRRWTARGFAGTMSYIEDQVERREDLRVAFPWARSIIVCALQYDTKHPYSTEAPEDRGWIARYAWGDDYHDVVRGRLEVLRAKLTKELGAFESRAYVDTGPIAEKAYAVKAGLGAYGKNTCVLNQRLGSWFFLGVLVTDLELGESAPVADICGTCRACLDACPTQAFPEPYVLDARKCISYLTIEVKGSIDAHQREGMGRHVFGCDICQDVCPWNRKRRVHGGGQFDPREGAMAPSLVDLARLSKEEFSERFKKSPIKRSKWSGFLRNVAIALGNAGAGDAAEPLRALAESEDSVVREQALWGLHRLEERKRAKTAL